MNYTLHQLAVLLKVRDTGSVTKASEELFLSQPAVSVQLKKLQDQFEIPLFETVGRRISITEFGHEIAGTAQRILDEIEAINYKSKTYQGAVAGKLKIGAVSTAKYIVPFFITDFLEKYPSVDLSVDVTNKSTVIKSLESNEIDIAMVSTIPKKIKAHSISLMKNQLYLVGGKDMPDLEKNISKKSLEKHRLIYREHGSATRLAMENYISQRKIQIDKTIELTSNEAIKQAVIAGLGVSIMPLIGIQDSLTSGDLKIIPAKGLPVETYWNIIWMKSKNLSIASKTFIEFVKTHRTQIIAEHYGYVE